MSNQVITIESPPQEFEKDDDPLKRAEPLPATSQDSISKQKRGKLISFAALALLALVSLMVLFWRISAGSSYVRFEPSLLTITVTFAVFAVNFSFVEYQLSPYRAMFRGIAWMHVFSALCVLLVAIIPIGAALMGRAPGRVAALLLPLIAVSSVVLALVARRCADPIRRAQDASHRKTVHKFVKQFASAAKRELNRTAGLNLSTSGNGPMHEWDYDRLPPRVDFYDPFDSLLALASASASSGDGQVFDKASDCMLTILKSITLCKELTLTDNTKADYRVRAMVLDHSRERLIQLARMTLDTDKIDRFARGFAEALVFHLRNEAAQFRQTDEFARIVTSTLSLLAVETYKRGWRTTPMRTLMVVRECVTMGMKRSSEDDKSMSFFYELIRFPLPRWKRATRNFCIDASIRWAGWVARQSKLTGKTLGLPALNRSFRLREKVDSRSLNASGLDAECYPGNTPANASSGC
jgi:hypothetical protein